MNGLPANPSACVTGFDQASFIMGTSSSFFNVCHIFQGFLRTRPDLLWQAVLDVSDGNFGFNADSGEEDGMNFLFNQLSSHTQSDAQNAANWPNVRTIRTIIWIHIPTDSYLQPFKGVNPETFEDSSSDWLELLDGGSNFEKTPLSSLLVKSRGLNVVVVVDGSADDPNFWPK